MVRNRFHLNPRPSRFVPQWLACVWGIVFLVPFPELTAQVYDIYELPAASGHVESSGVALNNSGKIAGVSTDSSGKRVPVLWTWSGTSVSSATTLSTFESSTATPWDINDQGVLVGQAAKATGETVACSWSATGVLTELAVNQPFSAAQSINNRGDISGYYMQDGATPVGFVIRGGVLELLDTLQSTKGGAVNDVGTAVANILSLAENRPFTKVGHFSVQLPQAPGGSMAEAVRVNNRNQVIGSVVLSDEREQAALWERGQLTILGDLGGGFSQALGINHFNQIVGISHIPSPASVTVPTDGSNAITFANEPERAFFCSSPGNPLVDLNTLIPSTSRWILLAATAINDRGQIVGYGLIDKATGTQARPTYAPRGFILNPRTAQLPAQTLQLSLPESAEVEGVRNDEPVRLAAHANHAVAKIRISVNGQVVQTITGGPYVYEFAQSVFGTHRVKIESLTTNNQVLLSTEKDLLIRDLKWSEWRYKHFGPDNTASTDTSGDRDGDGIHNLAEFAYDLDPLNPSAAPMVGLQTGAPTVLSFRRRKAYALQGLRYEWQYSTNLKDWYPAAGGMETLAQTSEGSTSPMEKVEVGFTPPDASKPSYFFRLNVGKD
jgi:uncharacterized membrane protein